MSKYMLIMRSDDAALEASKAIPFEEVINAMGKYNEEMMQAGVMVGGDGLSDASQGKVVEFANDDPIVTDGPYGETHELFNGFWTLEVPTIDEAVAWAKKAPLGPGAKLEIRRVTDETDFADFQDNEFIQKEEGWRKDLEDRAAGA